jgi:hypothetical protein
MPFTPATTDAVPLTDPNRLGLLYRNEAKRLPWSGPIIDAHTHIADLASARMYFKAADHYGITSTWSQTQLEHVDEIRDAFGDRIEFVAVPNYLERDRPGTFTTDFLKRIEAFAEKGVWMVKFWAAPRGRDLDHEGLLLDTPFRRQAIKLALDCGMKIMTHVGDPDTWFATKYADHRRYGTKAEQYEPLERLLDEYSEVDWLAAHMCGHPEDFDHLQYMLDRYPNLYMDTSATKWMVRELSQRASQLRAFIQRNPGRVLWGTDIVANAANIDYDLYASRMWALRVLMETDYDGRSPIVDPDLSMVDPALPPESTAQLRGAGIDPASLQMLYHDAAVRFMS